MPTYIWDICLCFYLKQCVCEALLAIFSYYHRRLLLSPGEKVTLVLTLENFSNLKFSPVSQAVPTGVLRQGVEKYHYMCIGEKLCRRNIYTQWQEV